MSRTNISQAALRKHRDYWRAAAYSTAPVDRRAVESSVAEFYRDELKLDPPKCVWIDSPRQANRRAFKKYEHEFSVGDIIEKKFRAAFDQVQRSIESCLLDRVGEAVQELRDPIFMETHSQVWNWAVAPNAIYGRFLGRSSLMTCAYFDFFVTKFGLFKTLKPWLAVLASCGGIWLHKGAIHLLDSPELLRADDRDRLHCDDGPALRWRDGTECYCLHGVFVPQRYVMTDANEISMTQVLQEGNAEVRLALINRVGFSRLLGTVRHWTISEANDNSLIEFRIKGVQFLRVLHLKWQDKTGSKETALPVPSRRSEFGRDCPEDIDDCEQVRRWTLGWPKEAIAIAET